MNDHPLSDTHRSRTANHHLSPRLQRDWDRLRRRRAAVARANSWHIVERPLADLDELLVLAGFDVPTNPASESVLRRLVGLARHDELAGRIVLQRIMRGLLALVRRRNHGRRRPTDGLLEELVGAAWITIHEIDLDRDQRSLAAALLSGAEYRAFGREERRRHRAPQAVDPVVIDTQESAPGINATHVSPCDELAELLTAARADGVDAAGLAFVDQLVDIGTPSGLATHLGVTPRTVRNRRDRITAELRRVATAA